MRFLLPLLLALSVAHAAPAAAQAVHQSAEQALAQDAGEYARQFGVSVDEAVRRLQAQEESVAFTDAVRTEFRKRLSGIVIEHRPDYRIVVRLTGRKPVPTRTLQASGLAVPVVFVTEAPETEARLLKALDKRGERLRKAVPDARGMGADPRAGGLVMMLSDGDRSYAERDALILRLREIAGVPVAIRVVEETRDTGIEGGARIEGADAVTGRHSYCTAGFVVTDGARAGLLTAAHCPDIVTYVDPSGARTEIPFVGQWGWSFQDVQVNAPAEAAEPLFYADRAKTVTRAPAAQRSRSATRAGDFVCHRGERTGYSCGEVELTHYAPPGALCGGPCAPVWVTVAGPGCGGGDSGGPIFLGTTAFGLMKGATFMRGGTCAFYYYMSLDYLPEGWHLAVAAPPAAVAGTR